MTTPPAPVPTMQDVLRHDLAAVLTAHGVTLTQETATVAAAQLVAVLGLALPPAPQVGDVPEQAVTDAIWALIEHDGTWEDRGVPTAEHYRERVEDVTRIAPILTAATRDHADTQATRILDRLQQSDVPEQVATDVAAILARDTARVRV